MGVILIGRRRCREDFGAASHGQIVPYALCRIRADTFVASSSPHVSSTVFFQRKFRSSCMTVSICLVSFNVDDEAAGCHRFWISLRGRAAGFRESIQYVRIITIVCATDTQRKVTCTPLKELLGTSCTAVCIYMFDCSRTSNRHPRMQILDPSPPEFVHTRTQPSLST